MASVLSEAALAERLSQIADPTLDDIGGAATLRTVGTTQTRSCYADRMVSAVVGAPTIADNLSDLVLDVLALNPHPFVVATAASRASRAALSPGLAREAQKRLLRRWMERRTAVDSALATESLAGAFLFACGEGSKPAFIGALDDAQPGEPATIIERAAVLAGLAWQWRRPSDVEDILQRLADDDEAGGQALHELALIRLETALLAADEASVLDGLANASEAFSRALAVDPELGEAAALKAMLDGLVGFCRGEPAALVETRISEATAYAAERRAEVDLESLRHWLRPRLDAETGWLKLIALLRGLTERLERRAWLDAVPVLRQLAELRRSLVRVATSEGDGLRAALDTRLATSFLGSEALRAQLAEWADDPQTGDDDRTEARAMLRALEAPPPGKVAGLAAGPTGASPAEVGEVDARLAAIRQLGLMSGLTDTTEAIVARLEAQLAACLDYVGDFRADCQILSLHLLLFLAFCHDVTPGAAGDFDFLFDTTGNPLEKRLQNALWRMLRLQLNGFPHIQIVREVPDVSAGRSDIVIIRPRWRIAIEVKRELTDASREGIAAYLGQAASYTQADKRVAFLVVLDLCSQRRWPVAIDDNVWVERVRGPSDTAPRFVVVVRVPGRRPAPSSLQTPDFVAR